MVPVTSPDLRPFLTARWRHLVMLNYEVAPEVLAPLVPAGTELDSWSGKTFASVVGFLFLYALQRLQGFLPWNPASLGAVTPDSSFNTASSFVTNTNWQGYGGETTMSYLTQMLGLTVQNLDRKSVV